MSEQQIAGYRRASQIAGLVMLIFGAVAAFDWLGGVRVFANVSLTQLMAGLATIAGVVTRWCEQQIPARKELDPKKPGGES